MPSTDSLDSPCVDSNEGNRASPARPVPTLPSAKSFLLTPTTLMVPSQGREWKPSGSRSDGDSSNPALHCKSVAPLPHLVFPVRSSFHQGTATIRSSWDPAWEKRALKFHLGQPIGGLRYEVYRHDHHNDIASPRRSSDLQTSTMLPCPWASRTPTRDPTALPIISPPSQKRPSDPNPQSYPKRARHLLLDPPSASRSSAPMGSAVPAQLRHSLSPSIGREGKSDFSPAVSGQYLMTDGSRLHWSAKYGAAQSSPSEQSERHCPVQEILQGENGPAQPLPEGESFENRLEPTPLIENPANDALAKDPPSGIRKKRKKVSNACTNCQRSSKGCSSSRPCERCVRLGIEDTCQSSVHKKRLVHRAVHTARTNLYDNRGHKPAAHIPVSTVPISHGGDVHGRNLLSYSAWREGERSSSSSYASLSTTPTPFSDTAGPVGSASGSSGSLGGPSRSHHYHLNSGTSRQYTHSSSFPPPPGSRRDLQPSREDQAGETGKLRSYPLDPRSAYPLGRYRS